MVVPIKLANSTVRGEFTGGVWLEAASLIYRFLVINKHIVMPAQAGIQF
jgi:hypothetical protein